MSVVNFHHGTSAISVGAHYDAEQQEFLRQVIRYQQRKHLRLMAATDYLAVLKGMGYERRNRHP